MGDSTVKDSQQYAGQILGTDDNSRTRYIRVNEDGNMIVDTLDNAGRNSFNGIFGSALVAHRQPYISSSFYYDVDSRKVVNESTGSGGFQIEDNLLSVYTGAAASSIGWLRTKEVVRYRAGRDAEAMFTAIFATPKVGLRQRAGAFTDNDGFAIGYEDLDFGVCLRKDGQEIIFTKQEDFNLDTLDGNGYSGLNINNGNLNIFRINYGYLGIAPIIFEVYAGFGKGWVPFHVIDLTNSQAGTHIANPYLPLASKIENTTNTTNEKILFGSIYAGTFNGAATNLPDSTSREQTARFRFTGLTDGSAPLVVVNNKDLYSGKKNYIKSVLLYLSVTLNAAQAGTLVIQKLAIEPTGGAWTDVDANNSILRYSEDATVDDTGAELMLSIELSKEDKFSDFVNDMDLNLYPNEYVLFSLENAQTATVNLSFRESERF